MSADKIQAFLAQKRKRILDAYWAQEKEGFPHLLYSNDEEWQEFLDRRFPKRLTNSRMAPQ